MKKFSRHDVRLLIILLLFGIGSMLIWYVRSIRSFDEVLIEVSGETYGTYDIAIDQTIEIVVDGTVCNTVEIKDGEVSMIQSSCPDHLCEREGQIDKNGQQIICLPNQVVVQLKTSKETGYDSIAQ